MARRVWWNADLLDDVDFRGARVYAIPMRTRFRGITAREGVLFQGPAGWGEFSPFADYDDDDCVPWLAAAIEQCVLAPPAALRSHIPVNCIVPAVPPEHAHAIVSSSKCATAKVKVADRPGSLREDILRLEAVRGALGPSGNIRVDANAAWDVDTAVTSIAELDRAAGGLEFVEQPCATIEDLAAVRRRTGVPIAADESIRRAEDPLRVATAGAADVAVIKCTPLGGIRRSLEVAAAIGLPCVVSSALETSVGLAAEVGLAAALPELDFACGLATLALMEGDVVPGATSLRDRGGFIDVPASLPQPDPALLDEFAAPPASQAWWRQRLDRVRLLAGEQVRQ